MGWKMGARAIRSESTPREWLIMKIWGRVSDPSDHLAEQRIVGVVEGEQKAGMGSGSQERPISQRRASRDLRSLSLRLGSLRRASTIPVTASGSFRDVWFESAPTR